MIRRSSSARTWGRRSQRAAEDGAVVCYEADELDPVRHTGWSVIATGMARLVRDPAAVTRYEQLLFRRTAQPNPARSGPQIGIHQDGLRAPCRGRAARGRLRTMIKTPGLSSRHLVTRTAVAGQAGLRAAG